MIPPPLPNFNLIIIFFLSGTCKIVGTRLRKRGIAKFCAKLCLRMIEQIAVFRAKVLRNLRNIFRFVLQKLRKSFANGNLICSRPVDLFNSSTIIYSVVVIPCRDYFNSGIKHFS